MNTVPNQKVINVNKQPADKDNIYAVINIEAMEKAAQDLESKAGFKLWCYFAKNQNGYQFALSSKAVENQMGIKIKAYNAAIAELIEKGYLVKSEGNNYDFYELPQSQLENSVIPQEDKQLSRERIRNNTNNTGATITHASLDFPASQKTTAPSAKAEAAGYSIDKEAYSEIPVMTSPNYFLNTMSRRGIPIHYVNKSVVEIDGTLYKVCSFDDGFEDLMRYANVCGKAKQQVVENYLNRVEMRRIV